MNIKSFFQGMGVLIVLNLLIKPVWIFGIDREVQVHVGFEAYGTYFAILGMSLILSFIADAGLTSFVNRQLAAGEKISLRQCLIIKSFLGFIYVFALFLICYMSGIRNWALLAAVCLVQLLNSYLLFFRAVVTGTQLFKIDAWLSVLDKLLVIFFCIPFLYFPFFNFSLNINLFLLLQSIALIIAIGVSFYAVKDVFDNKATVQRGNIIIKGSLPFLLIFLLMYMHNRLDGFLLERMHANGAFESGVFASAYRILDAGNVLGYLAASFLFPFAAKHLHDRHAIQEITILLRNGLLTIAFSLLALTLVYSNQLYELLYQINSTYNARVFTLTLAALPGYYLVQVYGTLLTSQARFSLIIAIVVASIMVNVTLNLIYIPGFGAMACAASALASQYLCGILCAFFASRKYNISFGWIFFVLSVLAGVLVYSILITGEKFHLNTYLALGAAAFLPALFMFVQTRVFVKKFILSK